MIKEKGQKILNDEFIQTEYLSASIDVFSKGGITHTSTSESPYKLIYIDFFLIFPGSSSFHTHMRGFLGQIIHIFGSKVLFLACKEVLNIC